MKNLNNGILYIIPTPIGNLDDISKRALNILANVDFVACEDTRKTKILLQHYNINKNLISHYKEKEQVASDKIINLLIEGKSIALVSDAGTPLISDPGSILIKKCHDNNIKVISVPGPCAAISAIVLSGFDLSRFSFFGFLNNPKKELEENKYSEIPIIIYEAPHRIVALLQEIDRIMPKRRIALIKEISKIHESYFIGYAAEILQNNILEKGEFVLIIDKISSEEEINISDFFSLKDHLNYYLKKGFTKKDAIKQIASDLDLPKNKIYSKFFND